MGDENLWADCNPTGIGNELQAHLQGPHGQTVSSVAGSLQCDAEVCHLSLHTASAASSVSRPRHKHVQLVLGPSNCRSMRPDALQQCASSLAHLQVDGHAAQQAAARHSGACSFERCCRRSMHLRRRQQEQHGTRRPRQPVWPGIHATPEQYYLSMHILRQVSAQACYSCCSCHRAHATAGACSG